jgi:hypothetical protein
MRKTQTIARNLLIGVALVFFVGVCQGQVDEQRAKEIAETATRVASSYPAAKLLRAHRREDLEDDLFRFQTKFPGRIAKAAYFFVISGEGYFVLSPSEVVYVDSEDGHVVHLVAVSTKSGEAYLLSGFKNASTEFNRLVRDSSLRISSKEDAEIYSVFCFTAINDPSSFRLISDRRQLKHKIEDYFYSNYGEKKARAFYDRWWAGFSSGQFMVRFGALAKKSAPGYEAFVTTIDGSAKKIPQLLVWALQISTDGTCETKVSRTLYPNDANLGRFQ